MRKALFFAAATALSLAVSLDANAASAGTFDFSASNGAPAEDAKQHKEKPKSFVALILENVGWQAEDQRSYIVTAMAQNARGQKEGCPEAEDQTSAKPEGAEEEEKKDVVGPEPLYFAF